MRHFSHTFVVLLSSTFLMLGVWPTDALGGQLAKLDIPTGAKWFGYSAATNGDYVVIGDVGFDAAISQTGGTAIVYRRDGDQWVQDSMLIPETVAPQLQLYGYSVAIDQDLIVVGADFDMSVCNPVGDCGMGSANVFRHEPGGWVFEAKLFPSQPPPDDARFGRYASVSGTRIVVSSMMETTSSGSYTGVFYIFRREGTNWVQEVRLSSEDVASSATTSFNGKGLSLDGDRLLVGALDFSAGSGAEVQTAYVFRRVGTTWSEESRLVLPAGEGTGVGGITIVGPGSVALRGDLAVVAGLIGNAFVFRRDSDGWSFDGTLSNLDLVPGNVLYHPTSVSIDGSNVLVTTLSGNAPSPASTFAVYSRRNTHWKRVSVLQPADDLVVSTNSDPVDMRNGVVVFGARLSTGTFDFSTNTGYIFAAGTIPAVTTWGVVIMALMLLTAATCIVRYKVSMS